MANRAVRIVARCLDDGHTEFGWQPSGGELVLPTNRYFPAAPRPNRWLRGAKITIGPQPLPQAHRAAPARTTPA